MRLLFKNRRATLTIIVLAAALASGGCLAGKIHPGRSLLKRRCSSCHTARSRETVQEIGMDKILSQHGAKLKLKPKELKQIRAYVAEEPPPARQK